MAISLPLSINAFANRLHVAAVSWRLRDQQQYSSLGTGEILAVDLGPRLWEADVNCAPIRNADGMQIQALIESLDGAMNSFYLYNPVTMFPQYDPDGSILGATVPQINSVGGNNKSISLKLLPASYRVTQGDMIAFNYSSSPTRRALHRIVETVTANGSGVTSAFEIRPHLRPGLAVSTIVDLIRPAAKVLMVPGSLSVESGLVTTQISFQVIQTLR